jgi:undecaprenyl-diphosphatase
MSLLHAIILGIIQGLTEFLPISSSGHLVLGERLLGVRTTSATFEVVVHLGTLLATVLVFWKPLCEMIAYVVRGGRNGRSGRSGRSGLSGQNGKPGEALPPEPAGLGWRGRWWHNPTGRLIVLLIVGTIPAVVFGVLFEDALEAMFGTARDLWWQYLITGALLLGTLWFQHGARTMDRMTVLDSLAIGAAQAVSIIPAISRSGATIATALFMGVEREAAGRFSFLLSIPAVAGAVAFKSKDIVRVRLDIGFLPLFAGFLTSFLVGYIALVWFLALIRRGQLHWFAYYCFAIAIVVLVMYQRGYLGK